MTTLEKIREEIEQLKTKPLPFDGYDECVKYALSIIDRYAEQEPCTDSVSRQAVLEIIKSHVLTDDYAAIQALPSVRPQEQTGHCKECKYFEYDSVAKVDGVSLIVAHEICNKWGYGCKTREDGYCYLFEPQESEDKK